MIYLPLPATDSARDVLPFFLSLSCGRSFFFNLEGLIRNCLTLARLCCFASKPHIFLSGGDADLHLLSEVLLEAIRSNFSTPFHPFWIVFSQYIPFFDVPSSTRNHACFPPPFFLLRRHPCRPVLRGSVVFSVLILHGSLIFMTQFRFQDGVRCPVLALLLGYLCLFFASLPSYALA